MKKTRWYCDGKLEREEDCHDTSDDEDDARKSSSSHRVNSTAIVTAPASSGTSELEDLMREMGSLGTNPASLQREIETLGELDDLEKEIESLGNDGDKLAKEYSLDEELAFLDSLAAKKN